MNPQEAISFLDKMCGQISCNREMHVRVQLAVTVIRGCIPEVEPDKKEEEGDGGAKEE